MTERANANLQLTEHCEKTGVAIALRTVHAEFNEVIDAAIKTTLKNRKVDQKFSQPRWEKKLTKSYTDAIPTRSGNQVAGTRHPLTRCQYLISHTHTSISLIFH